MIEIDLLQGGGLPAKSKPGVVALGTLPFLVPLVVALAVVGMYRSDKLVLDAVEQQVAVREGQIASYSSSQAYIEGVERERRASGEVLVETSTLVGRHMAFSPVVLALTESVPSGVSVDRIEVFRREVRAKVPKADDPHVTVDVTVYEYILEIRVRGDSKDAGPIQELIGRLKGSVVLSEKLEDVRLASQRPMETESGSYVQYDIECVFARLR